MELINYEYYVGKKYRKCTPLERCILQQLYFDWIMRPTSKNNYESYRFIVRFGDNNGYKLQAEINDNKKIKEIMTKNPIKTRDALMLIETEFSICNDELGDDEVIGSFKE